MSVQKKVKYGCNPHQKFAALETPDEGTLKLLDGDPSFINLLDALNAWQLVRELHQATRLAAAASFKHVSPSGAAVEGHISPALLEAFDFPEPPASSAANAYLRAREADPKCSFGDFAAVSEVVDVPLAMLLKSVVSDGIIAPGFEDAALAILRGKKGGHYLVLQIDPAYDPPPRETRQVFGFTLTQDRNSRLFSRGDLSSPVTGTLPASAQLDLLVGLCALKYTQSNSIVCAVDGQTVGVGAGQQSRIDCTRIACAKADVWRLRQHPAVRSIRFKPEVKRQDRINWRVRLIEGGLDASEEEELGLAIDGGLPDYLEPSAKHTWLEKYSPLSLASDGFIPFTDNIRAAWRHGVRYIAQPGGSSRDDQVTAMCRELGITLVNTGVRAFHH